MIHILALFARRSHFGISRIRSTWRYCFFSFVVLSSLSGCVTTRFEQTPPSATRLEPNAKILVFNLPDEDEKFLLRKINSTCERSNTSVEYLPEQEWKLKYHGISSVLDTAFVGILKSLGYSHFLMAQEMSGRSRSKIAYYTPVELGWENNPQAYKPSWNEQGHQSEVLIQLIPIGDLKGGYYVIARTSIAPLISRHRDGGQTNLNLTDQRSARNKALLRGVKKIMRDCRS